MRILITGGCGFLGSHLIEHFLKNTDCDLVVLDKLTYASNGYDRLRDVQLHLPSGLDFAQRVKVHGCDIAGPIPEGILRELGAQFDYFIHAAAETHVDRSIFDPLPFLQSNVMGTHHLLMLARELKPERVFLVSTDEVYGPAKFGDDVAGFDEQARFRPANPYAASKAGAEAVAMAYSNTYGIPVTIVNTMNLIGERQHPEKFVPMVVRKAVMGDTVTIHADSTRTKSGTRFYLHCRTYAHALWHLIEFDQHGPSTIDPLPIKLHVCGEREISNLEMAQLIADYVGAPLHYELVDFHSSRPGHDLRYAMQDQMIVDEYYWERPMGLEASLKKTVEWYLKNPSWLNLK